MCIRSSWCCVYICFKKNIFLHPSLYLLVSWACWDWPLTWLTNHRPSLLWCCWLGHLSGKIISEMTYNVSSGTLNHTVPYQPSQFGFISTKHICEIRTGGIYKFWNFLLNWLHSNHHQGCHRRFLPCVKLALVNAATVQRTPTSVSDMFLPPMKNCPPHEIYAYGSRCHHQCLVCFFHCDKLSPWHLRWRLTHGIRKCATIVGNLVLWLCVHSWRAICWR